MGGVELFVEEFYPDKASTKYNINLITAFVLLNIIRQCFPQYLLWCFVVLIMQRDHSKKRLDSHHFDSNGNSGNSPCQIFSFRSLLCLQLN